MNCWRSIPIKSINIPPRYRPATNTRYQSMNTLYERQYSRFGSMSYESLGTNISAVTPVQIITFLAPALPYRLRTVPIDQCFMFGVLYGQLRN